jgi:hypothetical protein
MRFAHLLAAAVLLFSAGCAAMVAESGRDLTVLKTREEVHAGLGKPSADGVAEGKVYEEYRTRQKIAERRYDRMAEAYLILTMETLGVFDLACFSYEIYRIGCRTVLGQTIRVTYDANGTVIGLTLDGQSLDRQRGSPQQDNVPIPAAHAPPALPQ